MTGFLAVMICAGQLAGMEISSPTGHNGKPSESIDLLIDGKTETKWNAPFQRGMSCMVKLEQPQNFNTLELTAANDVPARDPRSWVVEGSGDGRTWKTLGRFLNHDGLGERFQKNVFRFSNRDAYSHYRHIKHLRLCDKHKKLYFDYTTHFSQHTIRIRVFCIANPYLLIYIYTVS